MFYNFSRNYVRQIFFNLHFAHEYEKFFRPLVRWFLRRDNFYLKMGTGLRKVRADMAEHAMGQGSSLLMQRVAQNGPQGGRPPQGGPPQGGPPPGRGSGNGQQGGLIQGGGLQGGPPNRPPSGNGGPQGGLIQGGGLQGEGRD